MNKNILPILMRVRFMAYDKWTSWKQPVCGEAKYRYLLLQKKEIKISQVISG